MSPPPAVRPGDVIHGKYEVERVLGAGGMGYVVVAKHARFEDRVALKLLHADVASKPEIVERFLREGRAARKIRSEHVVQVTDVDVIPGGSPYLVMEYLDGSDLAEVVGVHGPLAVETAAEYILQVCEALAEAHAQGIVHRDLKPANLFLTTRSDGTSCIKVLDFGISKIAGADQHLTTTSATMGTPLYMSPEQLQVARDVDARTDIWALGVILYELVAGRPPFQADTLPQLAVQIIMAPPRPIHELRADLPGALVDVLDKCLAKDRNDRFANVAELAQALVPFAPARAKISAERAARRLGLTGVSPSAAPPARGSSPGGRISISTDPALNAAATVPFAATVSAPSTIGGTTRRSIFTSKEGKGKRVGLYVGAIVGVLAIAGGAIMLLEERGKDAEKPAAASTAPSASSPASSSVEPRATALVPATTTTATDAPAITPAPVVSASTSGAPSTKPAAPAIVVKKPVVGKPAGKGSTTSSATSGKSNEDY